MSIWTAKVQLSICPSATFHKETCVRNTQCLFFGYSIVEALMSMGNTYIPRPATDSWETEIRHYLCSTYCTSSNIRIRSQQTHKEHEREKKGCNKMEVSDVFANTGWNNDGVMVISLSFVYRCLLFFLILILDPPFDGGVKTDLHEKWDALLDISLSLCCDQRCIEISGSKCTKKLFDLKWLST